MSEPKMERDYPRAVVREVDGQLVLDDPDAEAVIRALAKHNCLNTLMMNDDRVGHFGQRLTEKGLTVSDAVIVLLNVDDANGRQIADILMPDFNWQEMRDQGQVPFARGLAGRAFIQEALGLFDTEAAEKLRGMVTASTVAVVVVDHGVAEVFGV